MKPRLPLLIPAGAIAVLSVATTVLAVLGVDRGYDWMAARCGPLSEVYPELGWMLFVLPPALIALASAGAALWLELRRRPPETWFPWVVLAFAGLMAVIAVVVAADLLYGSCQTTP